MRSSFDASDCMHRRFPWLENGCNGTLLHLLDGFQVVLDGIKDISFSPERWSLADRQDFREKMRHILDEEPKAIELLAGVHW